MSISPRDKRVLTAHVLGMDADRLILKRDLTLTAAQQEHLDALTQRRLAEEPLSRIIGEREFWSFPLIVTPDVLDPRPDSETLVEAVLDLGLDPDAPVQLLDLGTGSGCLTLALLSEFRALEATAVDISPEALAIAEENAERHGFSHRVEFVESRWLDHVEGSFDLIISNPPYIPSAEIETLDTAVKNYDPRGALDGGADGLDDYRKILKSARDYLNEGGHLALELGAGQMDDVCEIAAEHGWIVKSKRHDLGGHERVVILTL